MNDVVESFIAAGRKKAKTRGRSVVSAALEQVSAKNPCCGSNDETQ